MAGHAALDRGTKVRVLPPELCGARSLGEQLPYKQPQESSILSPRTEHANVAQSVGGAGFKPRSVQVRIPPLVRRFDRGSTLPRTRHGSRRAGCPGLSDKESAPRSIRGRPTATQLASLSLGVAQWQESSGRNRVVAGSSPAAQTIWRRLRATALRAVAMLRIAGSAAHDEGSGPAPLELPTPSGEHTALVIWDHTCTTRSPRRVRFSRAVLSLPT